MKEKIVVLSFISVLLVISLVSLGVVVLNETGFSGGLTGFAISEEKVIDNIKFQRYYCTQNLILEGLGLYGLNEKSIENHLAAEMIDCINPVFKKYEKDYLIYFNFSSVNVVLNNSEIEATLNFQIKINNSETEENLPGFSSTFRYN